jgi:hypothetical protein
MALSKPVEGLIIYPPCFLTVRSSVGLTHNICQLNAGVSQTYRILSMPLQMDREYEDSYLIILRYYRGAALTKQKGKPDTGYTYIELEFATALNVRSQEKSI